MGHGGFDAERRFSMNRFRILGVSQDMPYDAIRFRWRGCSCKTESGPRLGGAAVL
jgi:hypothetical protein